MAITFELFDRLARHAKERRNDSAFTTGDSGLTFGDVWRQSCIMASSLSLKYGAGETVLLRSGNSPSFVPTFLGALASGLNVLPIALSMPASEADALMQRLHAVATLNTESPIEDSPAILPSREAGNLLLTTSGSTGRSKVVVRNAISLDAVSRNMVEAIDFREGANVVGVVPLTHSYGLEHGLLAPLWAGSCVHLLNSFDAASLARLFKQDIDLFSVVPAMVESMAALTLRPKSLRCIYSAGAPLPAEVNDQFHAAFGVRVGQLYGMTEIGSVTFNSAHAGDFDPASVGHPMRGVDLRFVQADHESANTGELLVSAPSMLSGYIDEQAPFVDGHFVTGDLGAVDDQGRLTITGRTKLLIEIAGRKVNPLEVEAVLASHPNVAACVVVPVRQTPTVQRLCAVIELRNNADRPTDEDLRTFARGRLAAHMVPRSFVIRDRLQRSDTGKVLRQAVEESCA